MPKPPFAKTSDGETPDGVEVAGHGRRGVEAAATARTPRLAGHAAVTAVRSAGGRLVVLGPKIDL